MRWLSESVEELVARELSDGNGPTVHDAAVVGSGYGGAVSALRLAEMGVQVLVLERGKEMLPGEFPNDIGEAFGHVRIERDGSRNVNGYEDGLYDLRLGRDIGALVGNALGGTSQINAGVAVLPDRRVLEKKHGGVDAWPEPLRPKNGRVPRALLRGVAAARQGLAVEKFSTTYAFPTNLEAGAVGEKVRPLKTQRLEELEGLIARAAGDALQVSFRPARIAVCLDPFLQPIDASPYLESCISCGDCVSGCNYNAKKTLTTTYLPAARRAGARLFTGVTVLTVRRDGDHWVVRFVRTASRKMQRDGTPVPVHELHARHVILSAGTFGSTEILLRSRQQHGLALSAQLGQRFSTNGDTLAFGYMLDQRVNGAGTGSKDAGVGYTVGPTITAMIRVDDPQDVTQSMLIQDGAVPGAITTLFHEMVTATATLSQLDGFGFKEMPQPGQRREESRDWSVLHPKGLTHSQTLLAMAHDPCAGSIALHEHDDRLRIRYDKEAIEKLEERQDRHLRAIEGQGAIFVRNPALHPLPAEVSDILSGPRLSNGGFTVHPLGGCCMADGPQQGVVDAWGRVFQDRHAADGKPQMHVGLYVMDGSIVPTSLGANPLLAITALAEHAMQTLAAEIAGRSRPTVSQPRPLPPAPEGWGGMQNPHAKEVSVYFTEAMRSVKIDGKPQFTWEGAPRAAHLLLHMPIDNLDLFGLDGSHLITVPNQLGANTLDKERLPARLRIDAEPFDEKTNLELLVESGWISILPVPLTGNLLARWSAGLRVFLTWAIDRGWDETWRAVGQFFRVIPPDAWGHPGPGPWARAVSLFKLCIHASEERSMEYRLHLRDTQPRGATLRTYTLRGIKSVGYPASWRALGEWLRAPRGTPLARPNVWKAFGELHTTVRDEDGEVVGEGLLMLDMLDMTRMHAPQLVMQRDTINALLGLAGYPLWFARILAKTRLWDFRLPDYPAKVPAELSAGQDIPVPPAKDAEGNDNDSTVFPWPDFPPLRIRAADGSITALEPDPAIEFPVRRSVADASAIKLKITRYRRRDTIERQVTTEGMTQFKTIILINGFAQSTLAFVAQELKRHADPELDDCNLAEFFHEQGYEVWLFDYRTSSILEASKLPSTMDDIAQFDIPAAVDIVIGEMAEAAPEVAPEKIQIFVFAHCVGAASLAISLLGGFLKHQGRNGALGADKLAAVTFSQMQAFLVGSRTAQMRLQVGALLRDTLGIDYMRLSAAEREPTMLESLLDRLFASLPVDPGEHCPHEFDRIVQRTDICTCKRMSGTISRLLKHDRIKPETHERLPVYFGRANTSLLVHGGRCVEAERLVNADGQNVYVTDPNIRDFLKMPVAILHGAHNALFNVESARRTWQQLRRVNKNLGDAGMYELIVADDYAHFDCTIGHGKPMKEQILDPLRRFYDRAWRYRLPIVAPSPQPAIPVPAAAPLLRPLAKAPLAGPVLGWARTDMVGGKPVRRVRVWIEVDESEADCAEYAVTVVRRGAAPARAQAWPLVRVPLKDLPVYQDVAKLADVVIARGDPYIAIAVADLEFDLQDDWSGQAIVKMFSVHQLDYQRIPGSANTQQPTAGAPITFEELKDAVEGGLKPMSPAQLLGPSRWSLEGSLPGSPLVILPGGATIKPIRDEPIADVLVHENTMFKWGKAIADQAQRADPRTLSRKLRRLPLPGGTYGAGTATLSAQTIYGPSAGAGLRFAAGTCRHPGLAFEDTRADHSLECIGELAHESSPQPAFMLMLGDQIYADATAGMMDSPSAVEKIVLRHGKAFGSAGFMKVTSSLPTYMVMDDHEIGDNWTRDLLTRVPGYVPPANDTTPADLLHTARAAFSAYQWASGPRNGNGPGFNYQFEEGGLPFYVLDTRSARWRFPELHLPGFAGPQICDPAQLQDLKRWLQADAGSNRPKFVVSGSVLAPGLQEAMFADPTLSDRAIDSWQLAQAQRHELLDWIATQGVRNVVFLAGDYHCAATATLKLGPVTAYAIVTPPLYAQLPAANVNPSDLLAEEMFKLPSGATARIVAQGRAGDGFSEIRVVPGAGGSWQLEVTQHLLRTNEKPTQSRLWSTVHALR